MAKFITVGERIHCISPSIRDAMNSRNPEPILKRAKEQLDAGATYLDLNIGPCRIHRRGAHEMGRQTAPG